MAKKSKKAGKAKKAKVKKQASAGQAQAKAKAKVKAEAKAKAKARAKAKAEAKARAKRSRGQRRAYVVITRKGRVLLVKNRRGRWTLPGGRSLPEERLRDTARREVKEETGVRVKLKDRVSGDHVRHHRRRCSRCVVFEAKIEKGTPKPKREIVEVAWVKTDKAPKRLRAYRRKEIRRILAKVG